MPTIVRECLLACVRGVPHKADSAVEDLMRYERERTEDQYQGRPIDCAVDTKYKVNSKTEKII